MILPHAASWFPVSAFPLSLCGVLLLGCGAREATPVGDAGPVAREPGSHPAPDGLTCPSGEMVGTAGGYLAEWPHGVDDPAELVARQSTAEEPWVLVGRRAYVLRPDGTAFEVHNLVKGPNGWFLHGYEACVD